MNPYRVYHFSASQLQLSETSVQHPLLGFYSLQSLPAELSGIILAIAENSNSFLEWLKAPA